MVAANGAGLVLWMGCDIRGVRGGSSAAVTCPYRGQLMWKKCSWRLVFKASWWWQCQLTGRGGALGQQMFWLCIHTRRKLPVLASLKFKESRAAFALSKMDLLRQIRAVYDSLCNIKAS